LDEGEKLAASSGRFSYGETIFITNLMAVGRAQKRSGYFEENEDLKISWNLPRTLGFTARNPVNMPNAPSRH